METIESRIIECGVASFTLPGQTESGDRHVVSFFPDGVLVAVLDGVGHGDEAAMAAQIASDILEDCASEPGITLIRRCHEALRSTRGVVMSLASLDFAHDIMTWVGVGNVLGVLFRLRNPLGLGQEALLLRPGVVGAKLPALQASALPISPGDTLIFATDGVKQDFAEHCSPQESPQKLAETILARNRRGSDDALALVVRYTGSRL